MIDNLSDDFSDLIEAAKKLDLECVNVMRAANIFGGSFNKAIFSILPYADYWNKLKIKNAWLSEWNEMLSLYDKYEELQKKKEIDAAI